MMMRDATVEEAMEFLKRKQREEEEAEKLRKRMFDKTPTIKGVSKAKIAYRKNLSRVHHSSNACGTVTDKELVNISSDWINVTCGNCLRYGRLNR